MVPLGGVEGGSGEGIGAVDIRHGGTRELADSGDEDFRGVACAVGGADGPAAGLLVELGIGHLGAEFDMALQVVLPGDAAHVVVDIALLRKPARPIGFGLERPGVQR